MGLRKTSADSLPTLHRLEECASFSNPFSGRHSSTHGSWGAPREHASKENKVGSRPMPVNPWSDVVPMQAKSGSLRGVQRGNSAAMEILRGSPQEYLMGGELAPHTLCTAVFLVFKANHELGPHPLCTAVLLVFKANHELAPHRLCTAAFLMFKANHELGLHRLCTAVFLMFKGNCRCHRLALWAPHERQSQVRSGKLWLAHVQDSRMRCQRPPPC